MTDDVHASLAAFGTTKTIAEWSMDPRAKVWAEAILTRLGSGMSPEQAIATPVSGPENGPLKLLAWGERKTLRDWADDFRAATNLANIRRRIELGWSPEEAISRPAAPRYARRIEAWGETKSLRAWSLDERACAGFGTIGRRLDEGWNAEAAISTPAAERPEGLTAFGETKTVKAWAQDPRATVCANAISFRLELGLSPEDAITRPLKNPPRRETAFGETKTVAEWAADSRCVVTKNLLMNRLQNGWPPERALTEPGLIHDKVTAFGETKGLREWTRDPRCSLTHTTLRHRLESGMPPEMAITQPAAPFNRDLIEAFGESKSLTAWSRDPRCVVKLVGLRLRLLKGMTPEEAITFPCQTSGGRLGRLA